MCNGYMLSSMCEKNGNVELFYSKTIDGLTNKVVSFYYLLGVDSDRYSLQDMRELLVFMYGADVKNFAKHKYEEIKISKRHIKIIRIQGECNEK